MPTHHFYQQLLKAVDFRFVRPLFEQFYSATGRPSIDPVVFVKLLLVAHLENITSDRKLLELANLHLYIKANASMSHLKRKPTIWSSETTSSLGKHNAPRLTASQERIKHIHRFHSTIRKAAPNKAGQLLSNLTHYSPTDPDACIAFKTGKSRQLTYMTSVSVDLSKHVITHIQAGSADRRDSRNLLSIIDSTQGRSNRFGVVMSNVVADATGPPSRSLLRREL